jgi:hypothetical protein
MTNKETLAAIRSRALQCLDPHFSDAVRADRIAQALPAIIAMAEHKLTGETSTLDAAFWAKYVGC